MSHNLKPKEKAKDLIDKFYKLSFDVLHTDCEGDRAIASGEPTISNAIKCAEISVDELIEEHNFSSKISWNVKQIKYWEAVKSELLNYKTG